MAIRALKAFLRTHEPYRTNFTERVLLDKAPILDAACQAWVRRPWLQRGKPTPVQSLHDGCYIGAIPHYRAGIGHILAEWNTGLLWSIKLGIPFAHCPLRAPWNDFLGLTDFPDYETVRQTRGIRCVKLPPIPETENPAESPLITNIINHYGQKAPTLFHLYYGQNSFRHDETSDILREKYFARRQIDPMPSVRMEGLINVSVHVRRPTAEDSTDPRFNDPNSEVHRSRYFASSFFVRLCQTIEKTLGRDQVMFNIFSLGLPSDFREFEVLRNRRIYLNTDVLETFHNLVIGDILIVSPSGFSFKAGMISRDLKIAPHPWWHYIPEDSSWIQRATCCIG